MASISSPGIGSGIDVGDLVSRLVAAETEPAALRLEAGRIQAETQISALGALKGALAAFERSLDTLGRTASYRGNSASSANPQVFTATADDAAVAGSFELEVVTLARAQKLASAGVADTSASFGTGTLTIATESGSFSVTIGAGDDSLEGIRDAINSAGDNPGVSATIVNVDDGIGGTVGKLVLTSGQTGTANELTVTVSGDGDGEDADGAGLSRLVYDPDGTGTTNLSVLQSALDATLAMGTETITRSTNTIDDAIDGVTLNLLSTSETGETTELTIAPDSAAISSAVGAMVSSYNGLRAVLASLASYDAETGETGVLLGDSMLRGVERGLRRELGADVSGLDDAFSSLAAVGVTTAADGGLAIDSARLSAAIDDDASALETLFAANGSGLADRLGAVLEPFTQTNGSIDTRVDGLNSRLSRLGDQNEALGRRSESLQARLLAQFSAMDALVGTLQTTSTFLTQQFDAIGGISRSSSDR